MDTVARPVYEYKEFPRMVHHADGSTVTINSEEERPEGYFNSPAEAAEGKVAEKTDSVKEAEKAEKEAIRAYLDEYKVVYAPNLGLAKLTELKEKLDAHLAAQEEAPEPAPEPEVTE